MSRARYDNARANVSSREDQYTDTRDVNGQPLQSASYLPLVLKGYPGPPHWSGNARFGFGVSENPVEQYDVDLLHADWYVRFGCRSDPPPSDLEFAQTIRLSESGYSPNRTAIETYATAHRGTLWLIGNEPDCPWQDNVTPSRYAQLYHELYHIIKAADPTAKVAIGGVVQATPLRLAYLDAILAAYDTNYGGMIPVDVWNVHAFILPEHSTWGAGLPPGVPPYGAMLYDIQDHDNMTIFAQQIERFREWMRDRDQRDKPLVVSEYGILFPYSEGTDYVFDEATVETFMLATFDYFLSTTSSTLGYPDDGNRLVQAWCWYSLDDDSFEGWDSYSHLFNPHTGNRTLLGIAYANYAASVP